MEASESSSWAGPYSSSHGDLIHAVGMISLNYNFLEVILRQHYLNHFNYPSTGAFTFERQSNDVRLELIKRYIAARKGRDIDADYAEAFLHFLDCFKACQTNRNIIMHARVALLTENEELFLEFSKSRKDEPLTLNHFVVSLNGLRKIANDIKTTAEYGRVTRLLWLSSQVRGTEIARLFGPLPEALPEKPELPEILNPQGPPTREKLIVPPQPHAQSKDDPLN